MGGELIIMGTITENRLSRSAYDLPGQKRGHAVHDLEVKLR